MDSQISKIAEACVKQLARYYGFNKQGKLLTSLTPWRMFSNKTVA